MKKFLAFDLGAESGRSVLGKLEGSQIQLTETSRFLNKPCQIKGHWHWNTEELFQDMLRGLTQTAQSHPDILSIGCDTWGVDYVTLDAKDRLIEEPYCYRDSRNDGMMEAAFKLVPRETIYAETGIQFMPINTLYQFLAATRGQGPAWNKVGCCLMMADYFHFLFSGKKIIEITNASTTQAWNPRTRQWSKPLCDLVGIPARVMPLLVPPGTRLGRLLPGLAKQCGLPASVEVITPCSHDTGSAVAAVPAEGGKWAYLSSGTWSLLGAELPVPCITPKGCELGFTNEAGLDRTIRYLKNIIGLWIVQECRRWWEQKGQKYDYPALTGMAEKAKPFVSLIDPEDARFLKPGEMPEKIAAYCRETGQPVPSAPGETIRCTLESLALQYRKVLNQLEEALGYRIEKLYTVGGGVQNQLLCQFTADAIGRPVIAGPAEATALGNCLVQARAMGYVEDLAHLREIVRNSFSPKEYKPRNTNQWDRRFRKFLNLRKIA